MQGCHVRAVMTNRGLDAYHRRHRFSKGLGVKFDLNTITPFRKTFYKRQATYFVIP